MTTLILLSSFYPISLSVRSGNWFSVVLLVTLDVLMVAVRIVVARKLAALPPVTPTTHPRASPVGNPPARRDSGTRGARRAGDSAQWANLTASP